MLADCMEQPDVTLVAALACLTQLYEIDSQSFERSGGWLEPPRFRRGTLHRLGTSLSQVALFWGIWITVHDDQLAPPWATPFIEPDCSPHHLLRLAASTHSSDHLWLLFPPRKPKAPLLIDKLSRSRLMPLSLSPRSYCIHSSASCSLLTSSPTASS
jgi:hypothetical protein